MYAQGADFLDSRKLNHLAMLGATRPKDSQPPKTINSSSALASTLEISIVEVGKKAKDMDSSLICRTRNSMRTIAASGNFAKQPGLSTADQTNNGPKSGRTCWRASATNVNLPNADLRSRPKICGRQTCASSTILWPMPLSSAICLWWNLPHPSRSRSTALARHHAPSASWLETRWAPIGTTKIAASSRNALRWPPSSHRLQMANASGPSRGLQGGGPAWSRKPPPFATSMQHLLCRKCLWCVRRWNLRLCLLATWTPGDPNPSAGQGQVVGSADVIDQLHSRGVARLRGLFFDVR